LENYFVPTRIRIEWILGRQQGAADYNAEQNEVQPVWMYADLVADHSKPVRDIHNNR